MRILLAEDDRIPLEALKSLLTKWGHDVVACSNGLEAWQILQRDDAPTMAILDWVMPGLEGVDICRKVRELPRNEQTYLILLTGKGSEKDIVTGLEAGADDYVVKPFNREELWARVRVGVRFVEIQQKLIEAERSKVLAETAGAAAHKINQPLSVIIGGADLLLDRALDPFQEKYMKAIYKAGEDISQIVKQMEAAQHYVTTPYVKDIQIVNFDAAAKEENQGKMK
ncbi:MAG: response regulator [Candidatus Latescibacteria bacterium]|jgi:DNA-binding response OmpR family regulator|nr:response regulator [Candidatus Latescibacterota bacterium]